MRNYGRAFKKAFPYTIPVLTGYLFIGIAFGVMFEEKGYSFLWAALMSLMVYAGSGQYLAVNFFVPGQVHSWDVKTENKGRWGWMIAFHPDFIRKYPLDGKIGRLKFFSYDVSEALHISETERHLMENILADMENEYCQSIDAHTQDIIVSQLDVLLNYSQRFYTRQFQTRSSVEPDIMTRVRSLFQKHIEAHRKEFISVNAIAGELNMSAHYRSDLLRSQTGMNTQQHIHAFLVE